MKDHFKKRAAAKRIVAAGLAATVFFVLNGCAGAPCSSAYNLAQTALQKAQEYDAETEAPNDYKKALKFYRSGESLFEQRLFDLARRKFNRSRIHSEKAENIARLKKYKRGDFSN